MHVTTGELSIIGGVFILAGTVFGVLLGHLLARGKEQRERLGARQAEDYEDVLTMIVRFSRARNGAMHGENFAARRIDLDLERIVADSALVARFTARLRMYGSPDVAGLFDEAFSANAAWYWAYEAYWSANSDTEEERRSRVLLTQEKAAGKAGELGEFIHQAIRMPHR